MTPRIRISSVLLAEIRADLERPHPFAAERVGFIFAKTIMSKNEDPLVLLFKFLPVKDENFIEDSFVGARINSDAIREAMQRSLETKDGVFHVHMHGFHLPPRFSEVDEREMKRLIPSFSSVAPTSAHGAFLLGGPSCTSMVWLPGSRVPERALIRIVGYPMHFSEA